MKTGDKVKSGDIVGNIIRFQQKTGDIIVKDDEGSIHILLASRTNKISE